MTPQKKKTTKMYGKKTNKERKTSEQIKNAP